VCTGAFLGGKLEIDITEMDRIEKCRFSGSISWVYLYFRGHDLHKIYQAFTQSRTAGILSDTFRRNAVSHPKKQVRTAIPVFFRRATHTEPH